MYIYESRVRHFLLSGIMLNNNHRSFFLPGGALFNTDNVGGIFPLFGHILAAD